MQNVVVWSLKIALWLVTSVEEVNWKKMNPRIHHRSDPPVGHFGKISTVYSLLVVLEEDGKWSLFSAFELVRLRCQEITPSQGFLCKSFSQRKEQISHFNHMTLVLSNRRFWICLWTGHVGSFWSQWRCFNFQQKLNQCLREIRLSYCSFGGGWVKGVGAKVWRRKLLELQISCKKRGKGNWGCLLEG